MNYHHEMLHYMAETQIYASIGDVRDLSNYPRLRSLQSSFDTKYVLFRRTLQKYKELIIYSFLFPFLAQPPTEPPLVRIQYMM